MFLLELFSKFLPSQRRTKKTQDKSNNKQEEKRKPAKQEQDKTLKLTWRRRRRSEASWACSGPCQPSLSLPSYPDCRPPFSSPPPYKRQPNRWQTTPKTTRTKHSAGEKRLTWCHPCLTPRPSICPLSWWPTATRSDWEQRKRAEKAEIKKDGPVTLGLGFGKETPREAGFWVGRNRNFKTLGVKLKAGELGRDVGKILADTSPIRGRRHYWTYHLVPIQWHRHRVIGSGSYLDL